MLFANQIEDKIGSGTYAVTMFPPLVPVVPLVIAFLWHAIRTRKRAPKPTLQSPRHVAARRVRLAEVRPRSRPSETLEERIIRRVLDSTPDLEESDHQALVRYLLRLMKSTRLEDPDRPPPSAALAMPLPPEYIRVDARGSVA